VFELEDDGTPKTCPYRRACEQCPGDDPKRGPWEPSLGFKAVDGGVICLDWDKLIPNEDIPKVKRGEGRHVTDYVAASERLDEAKRRYSKSPKGREAQRRWAKSTAGIEAKKRYQQTEKHALSLKKYYYSKKGQQAHARRQEVVSDFRAARKWLKENPGKTYEDYVNECSKSNET